MTSVVARSGGSAFRVRHFACFPLSARLPFCFIHRCRWSAAWRGVDVVYYWLADLLPETRLGNHNASFLMCVCVCVYV